MAMGVFPRYGGVPFVDEAVQGRLKYAEGAQVTAKVSPYSQRGVNIDLGLSLGIGSLGPKAAVADSVEQNVVSVAGEAEKALPAQRMMMGTAGQSLEAD